jgi:hypothetical protein
MTQTIQPKTRDIPVWLTGIVLLLCIGGGGWLIKWYLQDKGSVVQIPDDKVVANVNGNGRGAWRGQLAGMNNGFRQDARNRNADGVHPSGRNSFRAKIGSTTMLINPSGSGRFDFIPQYQNPRTADEAELTMMRMSILADATWREQLKVTDEQLKDLRKKVPSPQNPKLDAADQARMTDLWKTYEKASYAEKPAAEKKLLAAVDEIGKKELTTYKAYEASRAQAIKAILTPEQIKLYHESGSKPAPKRKG